MNIMIHYVYRIVHTNGKYYIGRHSTTNIDDGYMGSGNWPRSIKNKKELSKEIIEFCADPKELLVTEQRLLNEHVGKPLCMNFNNKSSGFSSGERNPAKTEKEKSRKSKLRGKLNSMFGKTHSDTNKSNWSKSKKGKLPWNTGLTGVKTSSKGQIAWNKGIKTGHASFAGKTHSSETISRMKNAHANRIKLECPHCHRSIDKPNYTRYHGDKCKLSDGNILHTSRP